jgi:hypothetical protein
MSDRFQADARPPDIAAVFPPLPPWLADRLLQPGEAITWVVGPRLFNPPWERFVTHPALFLVALALGAACVGLGWLTAEGDSGAIGISAVVAGAIVVVSVLVLGLASGYFTRLVVTTSRLVILQGYETCRSWGLDELPRSLIRYGMPGNGGWGQAVDLDALKTMLGGDSGKFAEAKSILALGKQLDRIKTRDDGRR